MMWYASRKPCGGERRVVRSRVMQIVLGGFVLSPLFLLAGRQPKNEDGPAAQLSKAPPAARSLKNPFAGQTEATEAGLKLFLRHCAQCHGPDARGLEHAVDLHSTVIQDAPPGVLFWALRNGRVRRGMPSWGQLPDQQLWQIVTYVKTLE
jgi:mono/diheme cytochrome c family protein